MVRDSREEWKTIKNVFDAFTERNLFKLASQGHFDQLKSPIKIGKEANIFTAEKDGELRIVKIYRLSSCDFNRMYDYIRRDPRYLHLKGKRRQVIFAWAQREYRNLLKAREARVRVPTAYACLYNIIVMEYIGDEEPAPQLKDAKPEDPESFFSEVVEQMNKLYKADLIHADLSGFNILNDNEKSVMIDMSQSTPLNNPLAEEYLERDVKNICALFKKWNVDCDKEKVLKKIKS